MPSPCKICGTYDCKEHQFSFGKVKKIEQFSGSTPPEIFVGKWNYPNVYTGILAPQTYGDTKQLAEAEAWHKHKLTINEIVALRSQLIYGRTQSYIKKPSTRFLATMQEIAMTSHSVATEFKLARAVRAEKHPDARVPLMSNAAPVTSVRLEENVKIEKKVDYLVNDTDVKSATAMLELSKAKLTTSHIIKLLSAGLLGRKKNRKLVPTRWAITATDDTLSKEKLERIRTYPLIEEIMVFHADYLGNHYEFLLLPDYYSFEVIEAKQMLTLAFWHDHETFFPRKKYADSVTGAYYANRLALTEYLDRIKRQAQCLVLREVRPEYNVPLGVGILRETSREAFTNPKETYPTTAHALAKIQTRLTLPITEFTKKSILLAHYGKQKRLSEFF